MNAVAAVAATVTDAGTFEVWSVGGRHLAAALAAAGQPARTSAAVQGPLGETWGILAPDEVLLVTARTATSSDPTAPLRAAGALVTSVGAGLVHLRLAGPGAGSVLEAACPVDLSERVLAAGSLAQVSLAGMRAIVIRETASEPAYRIAVVRDLAASLRAVLRHLGAPEATP